MQPSPLHYTTLDSPVGILTLAASARGLRYVLFPSSHDARHIAKLIASGEWIASPDNKVLTLAVTQLGEYFEGKRSKFTVALDMQGTVFQQQAWRALQQIGYGKTLSYSEQAALLGDAKKARAVGMANGRNPISIIVPCHRVIGASGSLTGFGGGLPAKQFLLAHELKHAA